MEGRRLGSYEISGRLGAGGMGEVYRAHDPRLKRDVAIKVLPPDLAGDADRLARLQREAQLLAAVQDPNVAAVYGLEEADGTLFLVMELVEGEGLDDRIVQGPIATDEAVRLAIQVAEGLSAAHEKGVIHRDLKPSNVRVTVEDTAKVLDFGLAKTDPSAASGSGSFELTASPTMASPTAAGVIMGTAPYMSPEQARGKPLDRRTDVWSFGCLLYEMLTGSKPFQGETVTDVLASVVKEEPDWDALPVGLDARVIALLKRCLRKDLRQRQRDVGDVALQLREWSADGLAPLFGEDAAVRSSRAASMAGWIAAAAIAVVAGWAWIARPAPVEDAASPLSWLVIPPARDVTIHQPGERSPLVVSPTGTELTYVARSEGMRWLVRRALHEPGHLRLEGSAGTIQHAYSPDGRSIVAGSDSRIVVIPAAGGTPREVCNPCQMGFGGTWSEDGTLIVTPNWGSALHALPVSGGAPRPLTRLDSERGDITHAYPTALPGGTHVLFTIWVPDVNARMAAVARIADGQTKVVARGGNYYRYYDGHLLHERDGGLYVQRFELDALETTGPAFAIAGEVRHISADGYATFSVSNAGVLALQQGGDGELKEALWVDRGGTTLPALTELGTFTNPALSPDGRQLAVATPVEGSGYRIHVYDLEGGTRTEITAAGDSLTPTFSRDGSRLYYVSSLFDDYVIAESPVDGSTPPAIAVETVDYAGPTDWSPDGRLLAFDKTGPAGDIDVWIVALGESEPRAVMATANQESGATFSPDGAWLVYSSDASGTNELYIVRADGQGAPRQVTQMSVRSGLWSPAGGEIFIEKGEEIWSLPVQTEPSLRVGTPELLFTLPGKRSADNARPEFDVTADGQRFIVLRFIDPVAEQLYIHVIQNLPELIRRASPDS